MSEDIGFIQQASEKLWLVILLLIFLPPIGIYLLWQGNHFSKKARITVSVIAVIWMLLHLLDAALAPSGSGFEDYGSCSATFYENGCTYYRDDACNVVAKSCD